MSLLSLFEEVDVKPEALIAPEDTAFCENAYTQYLKLISQLTAYRQGLESLEQALPKMNPATLNVDRKWAFIEENYDDREDWTSELAFSPVYAYKYIMKTETEALEKFNQVIISYFNNKYNLDFSNDRNEKLSSDWSALIDRIITHAGGSLADAGINNLKQAFKHQFCNRRDDRNPVIKGDTITFPYVWLADSYFDYMQVSDDKMNALLKALTYFEIQGTEIADFIIRSFPTHNRDKVEYGVFREAHQLCSKFKGFKYFKNRRMDLKFVSAGAANEFNEMFIQS